MSKRLLFLSIALAVVNMATARDVFVSTSFHEPATEGLRFIYSYDGLRWDSIEGVFLRPDRAEALRAEAEKNGVTLSVHAPYYINLANPDRDKILRSFGWLLDISRCIYTLRTGEIITKTKAGEWALGNGLCPDAAALQTALRVRKEPGIFHKDTGIQTYAVDVGNAVQQYADVLERELKRDIK